MSANADTTKYGIVKLILGNVTDMTAAEVVGIIMKKNIEIFHLAIVESF